jgi:hypothetical protein
MTAARFYVGGLVGILLFGLSASALPSAKEPSRRSLSAFVNSGALVGVGRKVASSLLNSRFTRPFKHAQIKLSSEDAESQTLADSKEKALQRLASVDKAKAPAASEASKKSDPSIVDQLLNWINSDEVGSSLSVISPPSDLCLAQYRGVRRPCNGPSRFWSQSPSELL